MLSTRNSASNVLCRVYIGRIDTQQIHAERMGITPVRCAISNTSAAIATADAGPVGFTIWRWCWRMTQPCPLLNNCEVNVLDFLGVQQNRASKPNNEPNVAAAPHCQQVSSE